MCLISVLDKKTSRQVGGKNKKTIVSTRHLSYVDNTSRNKDKLFLEKAIQDEMLNVRDQCFEKEDLWLLAK